MTTSYVFELDGYEFPRDDVPARGPIVEVSPQRWVESEILGDVQIGTIMTLVGFGSQRWDLVSRASDATKEKLMEVYAALTPVLWKTPQNTTGFNVLMEKLHFPYAEPIEGGKWLAEFTLVARP